MPMFWDRFPFTNLHNLNLDWILSKIRTAVYSVNGTAPDESGNVNLPQISGVSSVNSIGPDGAGNVDITGSDIPTSTGSSTSVAQQFSNVDNALDSCVKSVNNTLPDSTGNVNLPQVAGVSSVNSIGPDGSGNVVITGANITTTAIDSIPIGTRVTTLANPANIPYPDGVGTIGTSGAAAKADHVHPANVDNTTPQALASIASPGISETYARVDHIHPFPTPEDIGALSASDSPVTSSLTQLAGGGTFVSSCSKLHKTVNAFARFYGGSTPASGNFFQIPDGYRPSNTEYGFGAMYLADDRIIPLYVTINTSGIVNFSYSSGQTCTQAYFVATFTI